MQRQYPLQTNNVVHVQTREFISTRRLYFNPKKLRKLRFNEPAEFDERTAQRIGEKNTILAFHHFHGIAFPVAFWHSSIPFFILLVLKIVNRREQRGEEMQICPLKM